jgi:hypothetical protein
MMTLRAIRLGDLEMIGDPPPKLAKALAVIADQLHPTFARQPWIEHAAKSKESCVLSSLAVRDFLVAIGFIGAQVRPVAAAMRASRGGETLHSLGIGMPQGAIDDKRPRYWNGHMVVTAESYLIDTTLFRAARPQWPGLAGMIAMPAQAPYDDLVYGLKPVAGAGLPLDSGAMFELLYLDTPGNTSWQNGGDAREPWRRKAAVEAMRERFGAWT